MLRRLFIAFLPSLAATTSFANDASWNCEQNKESKEWVCVGDKSPKTPNKEPIVKNSAPQATVATPIEITPPVETKQIQEPLPKKLITAEPNKIKPIEDVPTHTTANTKQTQNLSKPVLAEKKTSNTPLPSPVRIKHSSDNAKKQWNCGSKKGSSEWNCQPIEGDGNQDNEIITSNNTAEIAQNDTSNWGILSPAFNADQEQIFNNLTSKLAYDPWEKCVDGKLEKPKFTPATQQRESSPTDIKSNFAEVFEKQVGNYSGNVVMSRGDQKSTSAKANYNSASQVLDLHEDVYYREDELALHSDTAMLNFSNNQAKIRDAQFIDAATPLRGRAKLIHRKSETLSDYKEGVYTSCKPGNQDWVIHSENLTIDKIENKGTAKNAWMEFKGNPVFYTPYMSFPLEQKRASGFLMPNFGSNKYSGFRIAAPYYWNIAPNYDATITPRELLHRGPLLAGSFRYLTEQSNGKIGLEYMPSDALLNNQSRYLAGLKNTSTLTPNIRSNIDLNYVSDPTYFAQLGNALSFSNYNYLKSSADIGYVREGVNFNTSFVSYESINTTLTNAALPYRVLPRVNLNLDHSFKSMPLRTSMENEYALFEHSTLVGGQRFNTKPSFSIPLETVNSYSYLTPKVSLQQTNYDLTSHLPVGMNSTYSRTVPIFSTNSGLSFEKNVSMGDSSYLHTLEPKLFYLYVPYVNQDPLPVFDTALYDFQFSSLFRENNFSGNDRIQNANQISTAITSRLIDDNSGLEKLKLDVGQITYFESRKVAGATLLANGTYATLGQDTSHHSNLVTELSSQFTRQLSGSSGMQWSPQYNQVQRINAAIHYRSPANEIINVGYIYRKNPLYPNQMNDITQTDNSFRYPLYDNWTVLGRWQYSLLYHETQDALFGLEKENCCWKARIAFRHYTNNISSSGLLYGPNTNTVNSTAGTGLNGVFFEFELKGLGALGDDMDTFLQKEIYGFQGSQK